MTSYAAAERAALAEALRAAPADAPTLCAGWTARDLAAHVVARERRPDSTPGLVVPWFAGWTERVRSAYARRPYQELIDLVASGPPLTSPFAIPGVNAAANFGEFLVHTEDVRRGRTGWSPRELPADEQDAVWRFLRSGGRMFFRGAPATVMLARPSGESLRVAGSGPEVTISGEPVELLLYAFGRREAAQVELTGPDDAVAAVRGMKLGI